MDHPVLACSLLAVAGVVGHQGYCLGVLFFILLCVETVSWDHFLLLSSRWRMKTSMGQGWNDTEWGKTDVLGEIPDIVPFCTREGSHRLAWDWTGAYALRGWRQALWHGRVSRGIQFRVTRHSVGTADFPICRVSCETSLYEIDLPCCCDKSDGFETSLGEILIFYTKG